MSVFFNALKNTDITFSKWGERGERKREGGIFTHSLMNILGPSDPDCQGVFNPHSVTESNCL